MARSRASTPAASWSSNGIADQNIDEGQGEADGESGFGGGAPGHGAVVDVEDDAAAGLFGALQGEVGGLARGGGAEGGAIGDEHAGGGGEGEVGGGEVEHGIDGVVAVEDLGEAVGRGDFGEGEGGQEAGGGFDVGGVDAFGGEEVEEEAAERIVAETTDDGGAGAEAGESDGHVGAGAAEVAGEAAHLGQGHVGLVGDEVVADASEDDDVHGVHLVGGGPGDGSRLRGFAVL